jgi:hypothetical protein
VYAVGNETSLEYSYNTANIDVCPTDFDTTCQISANGTVLLTQVVAGTMTWQYYASAGMVIPSLGLLLGLVALML